MAAAQVKDPFVENAFKELAECPICCDVYDEPKMLPCLHSFCLKCLSSYGQKKNPGEMLACPVCREEFQVPKDGYTAIRANFFINRIKELYQVTQSSPGQSVVVCEACGLGNDGETMSANVENYCVDCRQRMCSKCCVLHKQFAICRMHQIIPLTPLTPGDESPMKSLLKEQASPCEVHPNEKVQLYCVGCKSAICLLCYALKHNGHNCESIEAVAEKERISIDQELEAISKRIEDVKKQEDSVELLRSVLTKSVLESESLIFNTEKEMIDLIASHRSQVIDDLTSKKKLKEKELLEKINELQMTRSQLESFYQFSRMLMENGNHAEVARFSEDTHEKAKSLKEIATPKIPTKQEVVIKFNKSEYVTEMKKGTKSLLGELYIGQPPTTTLKKSVSQASKPERGRAVTKVYVTKIQGSGCVLGIAALGSQIYVCRLRSANVDVYCLSSYQKLRQFTISGLQDPSDLVSCSLSNCIYINGQEDRCIYKIGGDGKLLDRWKMQDRPFRISADSNGCVTVTFREALLLRVYGMDGSLLIGIKLPDDMKSPRNAFFVNGDKFVVCHGELGEPLHRVCELDAGGKINRWYGGAEGSEPTLINVPVHMIRVPNTSNKYLVADLNNHRVHLIEDFQLVTHILSTKDNVKLIRKLEMHNDKLFVGQDDGCIQVFTVDLDYPTCKAS